MDLRFDSLLPAEMARKAEEIGTRKAGIDVRRTFVLGVLAGAFIALGAVFSTTAGAGSSPAIPYGWNRVLSGVAFSLGLVLVVVGGAELFTGNNLIVMAWANRKVATTRMLRNWAIVYTGNFVGALATAVLVYAGGQYAFGGGAVGVTALNIANSKCSLTVVQAVALGILCNALVCLGVWLSYSGRSTADKILSIVPPVAAFVAAGFEHSIANMYFIPFGLLIKWGAPESFWQAIAKTPADYAQITTQNFLLANLLPVTAGNVIGGSVLVGIIYWFVYLKADDQEQ